MSMNTLNTEYKPRIQPSFHDMTTPTPTWLNLLSKGVSKRDKIKRSAKQLKGDPSLLFKGLLGKSLLDKHINPFFKRMLPDSMKVDVLKQNLQFSPHDRFKMTLGARGGNPKIGLNWRF
jgi:hypothetical protein